MACAVWAIVYRTSKTKDPMSVLIAKEHMFIAVEVISIFILVGIYVFVVYQRKLSASIMVFDISFIELISCMLLFTVAIWICFWAKKKVELYLNYKYSADDVYSRIQLVMMYTILSSILALSFI
jgi:hypothetical protein